MLKRLLATSLFFLIICSAQEGNRNIPTITIDRDDALIVIRNLTPNSDGGRTLPNLQRCNEEFNLGIYYGPAGDNVETTTDDTKIISQVVVTETPKNEESGQQTRLEFYNETLTFGRPPCIESSEVVNENIRIEQGRSIILGSRLFLEADAEIGDMEGPISLERAAEGDSPALNAESDALQFNFDTEISTFSGNVKVTSEDRVSTADEFEFDEANGIALMRGSPARSTQGSDFVQGEVIKYFLNNNDVVVVGGISGEFDVNLDE